MRRGGCFCQKETKITDSRRHLISERVLTQFFGLLKKKEAAGKKENRRQKESAERKEGRELNKEKLRLPHVGSFSSGRAVMRFPSLFRALQFCPEIYSVLRSVVGRAAW